MGKGDSPRPLSVPYDVYAANYSRIFGKRENHAPATDTTPDYYDSDEYRDLCAWHGVKTHDAPTAEAPAGHFPNAGENI
jgi:hypothetical protein